MDDGPPLIFSIIILVLFCGLLSALEISFISANKIRLRAWANEKGSFARRSALALHLAERRQVTISGIIVIMNLAQVVFATLVTLYVEGRFGVAYLSLGALVGSLVLFLFGELLPKILASSNPERYAVLGGPLLKVMLLPFGGVSLLVLWLGGFVARLFNGKSDDEDEVEVSQEDFIDLLTEAVEDGAMERDTGNLVESAIRFDEMKVESVMVKWDKTEKVSEAARDEEIHSLIKTCRFTRLPVVSSSGEPTGVVNLTSLMQTYYVRGNFDLKEKAIFRPYFVRASMPIDQALNELKDNRVHMAFVTGDEERDSKEKGKTEPCHSAVGKSTHKILGIVTVEDILEALVGEIEDEVEL